MNLSIKKTAKFMAISLALLFFLLSTACAFINTPEDTSYSSDKDSSLCPINSSSSENDVSLSYSSYTSSKKTKKSVTSSSPQKSIPITINTEGIVSSPSAASSSLSEPPKIIDVYSLSSSGYARNFLSKAEQNAYDAFVTASSAHKESFEFNSISNTSVYRVFVSFLRDNPEHFWVESLRYYVNEETGNVIKADFIYTVSKAERNVRQNAIDAVVSDVLSGIDPSMDDYQKTKYLHDFIVDYTSYDNDDPENAENQNIYSVFVLKRSVCAGYARAMQYLMKKLGIYCLYVTGKTNDEGETPDHAWNLVKLDDEYYYIDATWDDPSFSFFRRNIDYISHQFFCITTEELAETHKADESIYTFPLCTGEKNNYFVRENLLFESYTDETDQRLYSEIVEAAKNKKSSISIRFKNREAYTEALVLKQKIMQLILQANNDPEATHLIQYKRTLTIESKNKFILEFVLFY